MGDIVYRVEHPSDHIGPYNHRDWRDNDRLADAHTDDFTNHPAPYWEFGYNMSADLDFSGFRDMRQMFRWFGGWLPVMINSGFRVAVYRDVEIVAESSRQVVFRIPERW
jgi:hypothetical protein